MFFTKTIDEITAEITRTAEHYHRAADAWEAVKIKKTKAGKEFANLGAALVGCRRVNEYGFDRLRVSFRGYDKIYDDDCIDIFGYTDTLAEDDPRREELGLRSGCIRVQYTLTPEEIRDRIAAVIANYRRQAAEHETLLSGAAGAIKRYREQVEAAEAQLRAQFPGHAWIAYEVSRTR